MRWIDRVKNVGDENMGLWVLIKSLNSDVQKKYFAGKTKIYQRRG